MRHFRGSGPGLVLNAETPNITSLLGQQFNCTSSAEETSETRRVGTCSQLCRAFHLIFTLHRELSQEPLRCFLFPICSRWLVGACLGAGIGLVERPTGVQRAHVGAQSLRQAGQLHVVSHRALSPLFHILDALWSTADISSH